MLNITNLATQWGKIFGGVNQFDVFRGTTVPARADTISALYTSATEQRLAAEGLYEQVKLVNDNLAPTLTYFFQLAKDTLELAAEKDSDYPINLDEDTLLRKLIDDAVAQADSFQLPTVAVGGVLTSNAVPITTLLGAPFGNGIIVGTLVDPRTGGTRYYSYGETVQLKCSVDSYSGGVQSGLESFVVNSFASVDPLASNWPKGSGVSQTVQSFPTSQSTLLSNAYFDNWTVANTPDSWTLNGLTPGVSILQSTDSYRGNYGAEIVEAPLNSELFQSLNGILGNTNYIAAIRIKRPAGVTGGVLTVALRDDLGAIINDALGNPISFTVALTGIAGDFILTSAIFSVPRGFTTPVRLSHRFTTAMNAGESIIMDTVELIRMTSLYTGGLEIGFLPGSIGWAVGDTYNFVVTTTATNSSFIRLFDRLYNARVRELDLPVAAVPTIADALIS